MALNNNVNSRDFSGAKYESVQIYKSITQVNFQFVIQACLQLEAIIRN